MRVFITSTPDELEPCQAAAMDVVRELGHEPVLRTPAGRRWLDPVTACRRQVVRADALLAIIGWRGGDVPPAELGGDGLRPWSYFEVTSAFEHGLPVAVLLAGEALLPENEEDAAEVDLERFVDILVTVRWRADVPPVLVVDQFEDLLKDGAEAARTHLGTLLAATAQRQPGLDGPPCRWLLAYRQEYHGQLLRWLEDVLREARALGHADVGGLPHDLSRPSRFSAWALRPLATPPAGSNDPVAVATRVFLEAIEKPLRHGTFPWIFAPGHAERLARALGEEGHEVLEKLSTARADRPARAPRRRMGLGAVARPARRGPGAPGRRGAVVRLRRRRRAPRLAPLRGAPEPAARGWRRRAGDGGAGGTFREDRGEPGGAALDGRAPGVVGGLPRPATGRAAAANGALVAGSLGSDRRGARSLDGSRSTGSTRGAPGGGRIGRAENGVRGARRADGDGRLRSRRAARPVTRARDALRRLRARARGRRRGTAG